jgi:DNA-binding MarR family transcriptional regulator
MKDQTIDYALRNTWQNISKMYNEEASKYEGSMSVGFVLLNIDKENGTPSTSLGPKMGIEPTSLTRTLKTMEEKGLIYRKQNPNDGRSVLVFLTDFGKEKREQSKITVLKFNETVRNAISDEQMKNLFEVTEIINNLISEKKIFS